MIVYDLIYETAYQHTSSSWCKMQVKFLQVTAAGHSEGQWFTGCPKKLCCVQDTRVTRGVLSRLISVQGTAMGLRQVSSMSSYCHFMQHEKQRDLITISHGVTRHCVMTKTKLRLHSHLNTLGRGIITQIIWSPSYLLRIL